MQTSLTMQERLRDLRYQRAKKSLEEVSDATGISTTALSSYENDELKDISSSSLIALARYYDVTTDYLLGLSENAASGEADLRSLHISDEMVKSLSDGGINNRLLCELVTHPGFADFLADLEIYVDGLAGIPIQNLNAIVDVIRGRILNKEDGQKEGRSDDEVVGNRDNQIDRILQTSHIEDDDDFFNRMHHGLDEIMRDLRAAHAKDTDNVPDNSVADMIRKNLEDYQREIRPESPEHKEEKPKKSLMDQLFYYFTKELKMSRNKLTEEETAVLENLFARSRRYKEELRTLNRRNRH